MKVLFVEFFCHWPTHLETCLEIIQRHLDKQDKVLFLGCNSSLSSCTQNLSHDLRVCLSCISRRKRGLTLLNEKIEFLELSRSVDEKPNIPQCSFNSLDDLRALCVNNIDIGRAVISSIISIHRNANLEFNSIRKQAENLFESSLYISQIFMKHVEIYSYDRVYVFNGRFAEARVILRICQNLGIDCYVHERGADINKYALYRNTFPHDISYMKNEIMEFWGNSTLSFEKKEAISKEFYMQRINGVVQSWYSFVDNQTKDLLPNCWDEKKKNIVIFTSSEDEFAAIGPEWKNHIYDSQYSGLLAISKSLGEIASNYKLYIRMHPNTSKEKSETTRNIRSMNENNCFVIQPESNISTYALLKESNVVVSFGSTIGVEAAYWGKSSILAGKSLYSGLGSVYLPKSHEEVIEMLIGNLDPLDRLGAVKYGYYMKSFGKRFNYYSAESVSGGLYKGVCVEPSFFANIVKKMLFLPIFCRFSTVASFLHRNYLSLVRLNR